MDGTDVASVLPVLKEQYGASRAKGRRRSFVVARMMRGASTKRPVPVKQGQGRGRRA